MVDGKATRRKKHRNSKLGCATCKRRRVKCQEDLPQCSNCAKHNTRCEYLDYTEKQLEMFRRCKEESQKLNDTMNASSVSSDAAASFESLSLGMGMGPHKSSRKKTPRKRVPENVEESSRDSLSSEHSRAPSRQSSLPSGAGGGSVSSHSDPSISVTSKGQVKNIHSNSISNVNNANILLNTSSTDTNLNVQMHRNCTSFHDVYPQQMSHDFMGGASAAQPGFSSGFTSSLFPDRLNAPSGTTHDYDNLLPSQDQEIIYPIYSANLGGAYRMEPSNSTDYQTLSELQAESLDEGPVSGAGTALPNAVVRRHRFKQLRCPSIIGVNYTARLVDTVQELRPLVSEGLASLHQIRYLYHTWLASFVYSAYNSEVMFSCLVNLTTNYLISNVFSGVDEEELDAHYQVRGFRDSLITHSIQHYAVAIRELRALLSFNTVRETAASVSYILSLMSMYDPEATVNSTICFRDGMFSVLGYSLHTAKKNLFAPRPLVPIHLQLVGNISRTIYFPAYDPMFLIEYEHMLHRLALLFSSFSQSVTNTSTWRFLYKTLKEFRQICYDTNTTYIPMANSNLHDLKRQTEVTFTLFYRWARFNPTRLLVTRRSTDPLEKLLNMYIILFRKAVYAILPQGKFIYLRDLNSPLMLDVFNTFDDLDFYNNLNSPVQVCIDRNLYQQSLKEIKTLAAYAIRVNRFIGARTQFLYTSLVYNEKVRRLYPIKNMVDWRLTLTDIHATRKEFQERIGLEETMIKSFNSTYISTQHYPRILSSDEPQEHVPEEPTPTDLSSEPWVDLLSMDNRGLLSKDSPPPFPY